MPDKTPRTKAEKKAAVKTVFDEWKHGDLHSGSKKGPIVKSQKQATAIALAESGQSNKHASQPRHPRNPGDYDDSAHRRSYAKAESDLGEPGRPKGSAEHVEIGPPIKRDRTPHSFDRPSAGGSHGYGHGAGQRSGALRLSGDRGAHRIGKR
jgi:hypothetical protein